MQDIGDLPASPPEGLSNPKPPLSIFVRPARVLTVVYALGFVVVNIHLARYAEPTGELLQARYLAAGITFVIVAGLPLLSAGIAYLLDRQRRYQVSGAGASGAWTVGWRKSLRVVGLVALVQLSFYFPWSSFVLGNVTVEPHLSNGATLFAVASLWGLVATSIGRDYVEDWYARKKTVIDWLSGAIVQIVFMAGGMLALLGVFARSTYPIIRPQYGGGAAPVVRVSIRADSPPLLLTGLSGRDVALVSRSDRMLFLLTCDSASANRSKSVAVADNLVEAITFQVDTSRAHKGENRLVGLDRYTCKKIGEASNPTS